MQILIIGGTKFLGRHIVQAALKRGHTVTTFNRGTANLKEQSAVKKLIGDRNKDLSLLKTQNWDAVIDTCGSDPESVQKSCEYLLELTDSYTFISTISVYKDYAGPDQSESLTLKNIDTDKREYGSLKAACEAIVEKLYRQNHQILRPGLIVGPYDPTDRFTYWPGRIARGGKVLAPGRKDRQIQIIDARDLADFVILSIEQKTHGIFNTTGPDSTLTMSQLLEQCKSVLNSDAQLSWWSDSDLNQAGIAPWSEMPLWVPEDEPDLAGFLAIDSSKAIAAGLKFRPLKSTIKDTYDWDLSRSQAEYLAGLSPEREAKLLSQ